MSICASDPSRFLSTVGSPDRAAYTKEPYKGETEYRGKLSIEPAELTRIISELNAAGWQTGIHAIGDAAIELVVDELAMALDENPRVDHRHYLNHFTVMPSSETMQKMAEYGIAITQQPNFTYTLEGRYVDYLDGDRVEHNNPLRTPMNHGIQVAISSDILPIGPMVGIYAAVTRKGAVGASICGRRGVDRYGGFAGVHALRRVAVIRGRSQGQHRTRQARGHNCSRQRHSHD